MLRIFNTRLWICVIVTVLSIILVIPTLRYFAFVDRQGDKPLSDAQKKEFADLRAKSIKLGLDLQGGVDFLLQVDKEKVLAIQVEQIADDVRRALSNNRVPAEVESSAADRSVTIQLGDKKDAEVAQGNLEGFADDFESPNFGALARGKASFTVNNRVLSEYLANAVEGALRVVRKRVDEFGLTQPVVARQGDDRIRVQIPGETDPEKIQSNLLRPATLEFRLLHDNMGDIVRPLVNEATFIQGMGTGVIKDEYLEDTLSPNNEPIKVLKKDLPGIPPGYVVRLGEDSRTDPKTGKVSVTKNLVYLVKDKVEVRGDELKDARPRVIQSDLEHPYKVWLEFNKEGTRKFAKITRDNVGKPFAIILEDTVYSAPVIQSPIPDGRCVIEGNFTLGDVRELAQVLKAGALPAPLRIIEKRAVEASLGADSIVDSIRALGVGGVLLILFMVIYYGRAGVVAVLAMLLNVLLILAFLTLSNATLTLSGIGGILLTMGMAVDANVLIYERLREELALKKPMKAAISTAFSRAFTVIFDSNITSMLPALALLLFEVVEGTMKGFWITLAVGLIANLYTGVTVTRALTEGWLGATGSFGAGTLTWFKNPKFPFMSYRFVGYTFSGALAVLTIGYIAIHGVNFAVDFTGGVVAHVSVEKEITTSDVRTAMQGQGISSVAVQKVLGKNEFLIRQKLVVEEGGHAAEVKDTGRMLEAALTKGLASAGVKVIGVEQIASEVGGEFQGMALQTIIVASICILLYLGVRFRFVFSAMAVVALVHDLTLTVGVYTLMGREINLDIISALLIILGYSVNDTIVVFDRLRELSGDTFGKNFRSLVDQAINMSLNRTLNTGAATIGMIIAMILLGGKGLADFALVLLIGTVFGTYSSTFIATALAYDWIQRRVNKDEAEKVASRQTGRLARASK